MAGRWGSVLLQPPDTPLAGRCNRHQQLPSETYTNNYQNVEFATPSAYEGDPEAIRSWMEVSSYAFKKRYTTGGLYTTKYGKFLVELGGEHEDIVVLDADLSSSTMTKYFAGKFPERFIQCGLEEQNMVGIAAGLAATGKIPFVSTFAVFAACRCFDQVRVSVAQPKLNVKIVATHGTAAMLRRVDIQVQSINRVSEGSPHVVEAIESGKIAMIINTPLGRSAHSDGKAIRVAATRKNVPLMTALSAAAAASNGIKAVQKQDLKARSLQTHHS